jgi:uncharacterized DUF497 family protein
METFAGFDWDDGNRQKCQRHGVSIAEIESLFEASPALAIDVSHSEDEERIRAVGRAANGKFVFVVFTIRVRSGQQMIRPISARYMHRKEVRRYEETKS